MRAITAAPGKIVPAMRYRDARAAIDWLCTAFGFEQQLVVPGENGAIDHAQLSFGASMIMLSSVRDSDFDKLLVQPDEIGGAGTQSCYLVVVDADAHCARARAAGAEIVFDVKGEDYGGRGYTCRDVEGHVWTFGTYDPWMTEGTGEVGAEVHERARPERRRMAVIGALLLLTLVSAGAAGWLYHEARHALSRADSADLQRAAFESDAAAARERAAREQDAKEAAVRAARQTAEQLAQERRARETAEQAAKHARAQLAREAPDQVSGKAREQIAQERIAQERIAKETAERAAQAAGERLTQEIGARAAAERAASEARDQLVRERGARSPVTEEARQQIAAERNGRAAAERALAEARDQLDQERRVREAAEQAVNEAREQLLVQRTAKQAAERASRAAREQLLREQRARRAAERAASEAQKPVFE